jgi:4-hydroxybenzoate polyprenyltransferase
MTTEPLQTSGLKAIRHKTGLLSTAIRLKESVFALPFAYLGMLMAAGGLPTWSQFIWITLALTGARTLGMSANRIIDLAQDALNPRTANRALVTGALKKWEMTALATAGLVLLFVSAAMLNPMTLALAPVAAISVVGYAYVKRFTWLTHFAIGWTDSIAPAGGWIAVTGTLSWEAVLLALAVGTWVGGFDIFYTSQDIEFDRANGVHSIPQRFGITAAFWTAHGMHLATSTSLLTLGLWVGLGWPYYIGWAVASGLLLYEHLIISPKDMSRLNRAFFQINGYISLTMLAATLASLYA